MLVNLALNYQNYKLLLSNQDNKYILILLKFKERKSNYYLHIHLNICPQNLE